MSTKNEAQTIMENYFLTIIDLKLLDYNNAAETILKYRNNPFVLAEIAQRLQLIPPKYLDSIKRAFEQSVYFNVDNIHYFDYRSDIPPVLHPVHYVMIQDDPTLINTQIGILKLCMEAKTPEILKTIILSNRDNEELTEKIIDACAWDLADSHIFEICNALEKTAFYRNYIVNQSITDKTIPYYILKSKVNYIERIDCFDRLSNEFNIQWDNERRIEKERVLQDSVRLELEAFKIGKHENNPIRKACVIERLKNMLGEHIIRSLPWNKDLSKINFENILTETNYHQPKYLNCKIVDDCETYDLLKSFVECEYTVYMKGYHNEMDALSKSKEIRDHFILPHPGVYASIITPCEGLSCEELESFIPEYMDRMGYGEVPYIAFLHETKNKLFIDIFAENLVCLDDGLFHAVSPVLNPIMSDRILSQLEEKYGLNYKFNNNQAIQNIMKYLEDESQEYGPDNEATKLKL